MSRTILFLLILFFLNHCRSIENTVKDLDDPENSEFSEDLEDESFFGEDEKADQKEKTTQKDILDRETGYASWYGKEMHGKPTASGEIFDMTKAIGIHRKYEMGSLVLIRNLQNNKKKIIRIIDRGPYIEGRVIDVSYAVAKELNFAEKGVAKVEIELLKRGKKSFLDKVESGNIRDGDTNNYPKGYIVQVGAFKVRQNAERYRDEMEERYNHRVFVVAKDDWNFVWIGGFEMDQDAKDFYQQLRREDVDAMYLGKI